MERAVLVVQIEQTESLALNEFFDYNGHCYALTCKRDHRDEVALDLEDFYEATVGTNLLEDIDVYLVKKREDDMLLYGWYRNAMVYRYIQHPSLFLEGNVVAGSSDVMFMEKPVILSDFAWYVGSQMYEVIEREDTRYQLLCSFRDSYHGKNRLQRFPYLHITLEKRWSKSFESCIVHCEELAAAIMNDSCRGIEELAELRAYAKQATERNRGDADGFYYLAMACYQLGFLKDAMKAVEKALRLEPEASDIIAQKAAILVSMGYMDSAKELFQKAYELSSDESYLVF